MKKFFLKILGDGTRLFVVILITLVFLVWFAVINMQLFGYLTVARNHSHTCARAAFTSPQLLFESGVYFVQELRIVWLLFKDGVYSKKYGICECTNLFV